MKNKGFTLIELLAVIVILAIIALIATPIILNIIDNTKEQSVKRSIDHYMSAATTAIARENLNNTSGGVNPTECEINSSGNLVCDGYEDKDPILVEIDGDKPKTGGTITFENGKITQIHLTMPDGNTYVLDEKGNVVKFGEGSEVTPNPDPNPGEGSVPGTGDGDGESGTLYTGEIYRTSEDIFNIGDNISGKSYETDLSNIGKNVYLKHVVENNIIKENYVCVTYEDGTRKDVCFRGGPIDDDIYENNKNMIVAITEYIETLTYDGEPAGGYCTVAKCYSDNINIVISKTSPTYAAVDGWACQATSQGIADCYEN